MEEQRTDDGGTGGSATTGTSLSPVALSLCVVCFRCSLCGLGYYLFDRSPESSLRLEGTAMENDTRPWCART